MLTRESIIDFLAVFAISMGIRMVVEGRFSELIIAIIGTAVAMVVWKKMREMSSPPS